MTEWSVSRPGSWLTMMLPTALFGVVVLVGGQLMERFGHQELGAALMWVTAVLAVVGGLLLMRGRSTHLKLEGGTLRVDDRPVIEWPLTGSDLHFARWEFPGSGAMGSIAIFEAAGRTLRIGGHDHTFDDDGLYDAPGSYKVDLLLEQKEFAELVKALRGFPGLAWPKSITGGARATFELLENRARAGGALRQMAPWLATIATVCVLGPLMGLLHLDESPAGRVMMMVVIGVVIVTGLVLTMVGSMRKRLGCRLVVERGVVSLFDAKDVMLGSGTHCRIEKSTWAHGSFRPPALVVHFPNGTSLQVGTFDSRWSWEAPRGRAPRFVIGEAEWPRLVSALGLTAGSSSTVSRDFKRPITKSGQ